MPAEPVDRAAILAEIAGHGARARTRRATRARSSGSLYCGDHDHYALPRRGVRPLLARQRAAARHVPERHEVRGRDHRDDLGPAARHGRRRRHERRLGEPHHRALLLPRARARDARRHPAQRRHADDRARRARQGRALDGHRGAARAADRRVRRRRRRDGRRSSTTRPSPSSAARPTTRTASSTRSRRSRRSR